MVTGMTPMVVLCVSRNGQDSNPGVEDRSGPDKGVAENLRRWATYLSKYAPAHLDLGVCYRWLRGLATTFTEHV